jgi:hydrophobic/amphiphilic exporter-1 (mainly G- bacteria), HAE1 family
MMRRMIEIAIGNPVAMNLLMLVTLLLGGVSLIRIPRENFPNFSIDRLSINVIYPGASPAETEEGICIKIEEAIDGVDGIRSVESQAQEGAGVVIVRIEPGKDPKRLLDDIKQAIDRITSFPEQAEDPEIEEILLRVRVLELVLHGDISERTIKELSREIRDEILRLGDLSDVSILGTRHYEMAIEIKEDLLRAYGLTFDQVANLIRASSFNLPAGSIKAQREEYIVRIYGQRYEGPSFEALPLLTRSDGTVIRLGDIAEVRDGFEEEPILMEVEGKRAVMLGIYKTNEQNAITISKRVSEYVKKKQATLPRGLTLQVWANETRYIEGRLGLLTKNGWMGLILVFISLWMFLEFRLAFWVAWGIPVSFAGALIIFDVSGQSLNLISAFGLIMALGIIVDDAIVVGENVFSHRKSGKDALTAAIDGTAEVAVPVFASTLTTIAAFIPLFMVTGVMGKFISVLPLAMLSCLLVSLVEAMLILPVHLREDGVASEKGAALSFLGRLREKIRNRVTSLFDFFIARVYEPFLSFCLNGRYVTVSVFIASLVTSAGILLGGFVGMVPFPKDESEDYIARLRLAAGTPLKTTLHHLKHIEDSAKKLNKEFRKLNGGDVIERVIAVGGEWSGLPPESGSHFGEVQISLTASESRKVGSEAVLARWRELVGRIPQAISLLYKTKDLKPGGSPVEIILLGEEISVLREAADDLRRALSGYEGVFDIDDNLRPGKRELRISLTPWGRTTGLTLNDVSAQLRGAFFGAEARRIQRGRDEIKVKVRSPLGERRHVSQLQNMTLLGKSGESFPFLEVAKVDFHRGFSTIRRKNGRRRVTVMADVDEAQGNASEIVADVVAKVIPVLKSKYGIDYSLEGQAQESRESLESLGPGFLLALFLIYCILAVLFRSYTQPLIIMIAIPFSVVGVLIGHVIFGLDLSLLSLFGAVALAGIVVNDALVLVDFINRGVAKGYKFREAVEKAGSARFRAIVLTSLTTVAGLFPLVLETSRQAKFIIPMAVTISMGLAFATFINLILVPSLYLILVDLKNLFNWLRTGQYEPRAAPEKVSVSGRLVLVNESSLG